MSEAEKLAQREKAVLYLRHRLQKGFLSRDQAPQEHEMSLMDEFFTQLEAYENLEAIIIRNTKIHKVLKAIVKLISIPKDEQYSFKKRSATMLEIWNKRMDADAEAAAPASAAEEPKSAPPEDQAPETNGEQAANPVSEAKEEVEAKEGVPDEMHSRALEVADEIGEKVEDKADEEEETIKQADEEPPAAPVEKTVSGNDAEDEADNAEGDVSMQTAPEESTVNA